MYNDLKIIIVCEGYDDYLAKTLPRNIKAIFPAYRAKEIVIVTDANDRKTWDIADKSGCVIVLSSHLHEDGAKFAKGKAINDAIRCIDPTDWVLLMDADILLPTKFTDMVDLAKMDKDVLYYATRKEYGKRDETRPHGYFQLFNVKASSLAGRRPIYPQNSRTAGGDDDRFGLDVFSSAVRKKMPFPFYVRHLHHGKFMENWNGRKSPRIDVVKNN